MFFYCYLISTIVCTISLSKHCGTAGYISIRILNIAGAKSHASGAKIPAAQRRGGTRRVVLTFLGRAISKAFTAKFENEHENPANFQNSASYRFEFPWALL